MFVVKTARVCLAVVTERMVGKPAAAAAAGVNLWLLRR
jgi:hypothetical protein